MIDPEVRNAIIYIVTAVWAVNFAAGLVPPLHYTSDQTINAVFMAIVGGLFALNRGQPPRDGDPK